MTSSRVRVYLALTAASILWGSLYTAAKPAVATTGAVQVTLCRVALAFVCLGLLMVMRGDAHILLGGVALVFLPDLIVGGSNVSMIGVVLSSAGSGVIAMGTIVGRRVMPHSDPIAVSALASGVAIVPMSLLTLASGGFAPILDASASNKLLLLYLGIGCTAINFALWYYGLKHLRAAAFLVARNCSSVVMIGEAVPIASTTETEACRIAKRGGCEQ